MSPSDATVDYLEAYEVDCDTGYTVSGPGEMRCQADAKLSVTHSCDSKYYNFNLGFVNVLFL